MNYFTRTATLTRPADTNQYAVNDAIANTTGTPTLLTITLDGFQDANAWLDALEVWTNNKAHTQAIEIWAFTGSPNAISRVGDNALVGLANTDSALLAFKFRTAAFSTLDATASTGAVSINEQIGKMFKVPNVTTPTLTLVILTPGVFTPTSGQTFTFRFYIATE